MQGAYGGLIIIIGYGLNQKIIQNYFQLLNATPFNLLSGEQLILL